MTLRPVLTATLYICLVPLVGGIGAWGTPIAASPFAAVEAPGLAAADGTQGPATPLTPPSPDTLSIVAAQRERRDAAAGLAPTVAAIARAANGPVWLAYTVPAIAHDGTRRAWTSRVDRVVLDDEGHLQPGSGSWEDTSALVVLARLNGGRVTRVVSTDARVTVDAGHQTVITLDRVRPGESVAWLAGIVRDEAVADDSGGSDGSSHRCGQGALVALALTDDPSVDVVLPTFTAADRPSWLRRDAAFWLGAARGRAGAAVVDRLARTDPDEGFRQHLTFVLTLTGTSGVDTLIDLARHDASAGVRGQALFWLAQKAGQRAVGTLAHAVDDDPNADVRKRAVFAISQLPKDQAVPKLIELASRHRDPGVRQQAMFWLGQSGDQRALAFFEDVLTH